jgi:hypothetical protein
MLQGRQSPSSPNTIHCRVITFSSPLVQMVARTCSVGVRLASQARRDQFERGVWLKGVSNGVEGSRSFGLHQDSSFLLRLSGGLSLIYRSPSNRASVKH